MSPPRVCLGACTFEVHWKSLLCCVVSGACLWHNGPLQRVGVCDGLGCPAFVTEVVHAPRASLCFCPRRGGGGPFFRQLSIHTTPAWLPWKHLKSLREIRRLSFVDFWHICCTPPAFCVYVIHHLYYSVVYVGITHQAPVRRLRKHMTDALASTDGSSLHEFMTRSNLEDRGIAPLEYVNDSWWAAVRERHWWYVFRRWALNDVAPGIPDRENPLKTVGG